MFQRLFAHILIARCDALLKELFARSGLRLIKDTEQKDFPKELFAVKMYVLLLTLKQLKLYFAFVY